MLKKAMREQRSATLRTTMASAVLPPLPDPSSNAAPPSPSSLSAPSSSSSPSSLLSFPPGPKSKLGGPEVPSCSAADSLRGFRRLTRRTSSGSGWRSGSLRDRRRRRGGSGPSPFWKHVWRRVSPLLPPIRRRRLCWRVSRVRGAPANAACGSSPGPPSARPSVSVGGGVVPFPLACGSGVPETGAPLALVAREERRQWAAVELGVGGCVAASWLRRAGAGRGGVVEERLKGGGLLLGTYTGPAPTVMLYDDCKNLIASRFLKQDEIVECGATLAFGTHLVDIGEPEGDHKSLICPNVSRKYGKLRGSPDGLGQKENKNVACENRPSQNYSNTIDSGIKENKKNKLQSRSSHIQLNATSRKITVGSEDKLGTSGVLQTQQNGTQTTRKEWNALYTTQNTQKARKYHDGVLRLVCGSHMNQVSGLLLGEARCD